jgi:hypothetical protein
MPCQRVMSTSQCRKAKGMRRLRKKAGMPLQQPLDMMTNQQPNRQILNPLRLSEKLQSNDHY